MADPRNNHLEALGEPAQADDDQTEPGRPDGDFADEHNDVTLADQDAGDDGEDEDDSPHGLAGAD